ncbi:MAG: zinc ribbon domain-containing protein [Myxococcales bacterium]|nr:zinc ribbon domain-containing protein [Myxococcales bacterium]
MTTSNSAVGHTQPYERALLIVEAIFGLGVVAVIIGTKYGAFPTINFIACALALAFTAWVFTRMVASVSDPTLQVTGRVRDYQRERLEDEKRLLLQGIKDLEADFATAKMNEAEYLRLRRSAETRAIAIIQELKATDEHWSHEAEKLVAVRTGRPVPAKRKAAKSTKAEPTPAQAVTSSLSTKILSSTAPAADHRLFDDRQVVLKVSDDMLVCEACGYANDMDAYFCGGCGRPRAEEKAA